MARYSFDGQKLKQGGRTIANVRDNKIREGSGSKVICNIRGNFIRERSGSKTEFNLKGDDIRIGAGASRIADMDDVDKEIDGPGAITKAALWLYFVR